MKILIVNEFGNGQIKTANFLPRKGDRVDLFYKPYPTVTDVLLWPSKELLSEMTCTQEIDAIVTVA